MKNTFKAFIFTASLLTSTAFAAGDHDGKMEGGMHSQEGQMGMMNGMKMKADMKMKTDMMSKCADELEKDTPNPAQLKSCANMMRKQADMMKSCMEKGCSMMENMMEKGKKPHHDDAK